MSTLQLRNGVTIDLLKKSAAKEEEAVPAEEPLPSIVPKPADGVKLEDLPAAPKQMNVIGAIAAYKLLGISDADIAYALGCTNDQLFSIVQSDAYTRAWDRIIESFQNGERETAKDYIAANAIKAAETLVTVMKTSRNEANKLRAAEGVLNRTGITDANSNNGMGQGLVIKVVKDTPNAEVTIKVGA